MHALQRLIEDAGFECRTYSGRGMYGKQCLGVIVSNLGKFFADTLDVFADVARQDDEVGDDLVSEVIHAFRTMQWDSMGHDLIVYFPRVEYTGHDLIVYFPRVEYTDPDDDGIEPDEEDR